MKRNYLSGARKHAAALEKKKRDMHIAEKTHKLTTFFKQTRHTTEDDDVEQSSAPKTDTEVQTVLGSSSKPMVNADVNASPEPVSVMGDVICDDLHLWPEKISENFRKLLATTWCSFMST